MRQLQDNNDIIIYTLHSMNYHFLLIVVLSTICSNINHYPNQISNESSSMSWSMFLHNISFHPKHVWLAVRVCVCVYFSWNCSEIKLKWIEEGNWRYSSSIAGSQTECKFNETKYKMKMKKTYFKSKLSFSKSVFHILYRSLSLSHTLLLSHVIRIKTSVFPAGGASLHSGQTGKSI